MQPRMIDRYLLRRRALRAAFMAIALCCMVLAPVGAGAASEVEDRWRNTLETGKSALASGNATVAENFLRQAISQAMALSDTPSTNLALAESYEAMAQVRARQGAVGPAQDLMNQAIAIRRSAQPSDHPDLGRSVLRFADLQRLQGNYGQADRLYRDSIDTITTALGPADLLLAEAYYGLALNEIEQGRTESADQFLLRALTTFGLQDDILLRDHLLDLMPFAEKYREMGLLDDSERILAQAMDFYARHYAVDHPYYENAMMTRGAMQLDRGRVDEARTTFSRGTDQMSLAMGPGSERVASTMERIAELFDAGNHPEETEAFYQKALDIRGRSIGSVDADKVRALVKLGDHATGQGRRAEAEQYYREAIELSEARLGPADPEAAYAYSNMGLLMWRQGRIDEADRLWTKALQIYAQRPNSNDNQLATAALNLGQLRQHQERYNDAEALFRRALGIRESVLGPNDPETLRARSLYANVLDRLGRQDEARQIRNQVN